MEPFKERTCPNCGHVINLGDKQCKSCGTKLFSQPGQPGDLRSEEDQFKEMNRTDNVRMLLTVIISIIIIVGITELGRFNIY